MMRASPLLALALSLVGCNSAGLSAVSGSWKPGLATRDISVAQLTRHYVVHVPAKRPTTAAGVVRAYSLVIVLHGSSGTAEDIRESTGMDSLSESARFVVVYPEGVKGAGGLFPSDWNAGECCGAASRENIDDVGFIAAIIAQVGANLALDKTRVYVAGFSDGGRMAHHVGCKLAPMIAAIAVVSGSLKDATCAPAKPVALIAVHATSDDQVSFSDDALTSPPVAVTGVAATLPTSIQFWIAADGCKAGVQNRIAADVVRTTFGSCSGAEVAFYAIQGGSHAWPGDRGNAGSQLPMSEVQASSLIAQFFARQVRR